MMFSNDAMATNASEFQEPQCIEVLDIDLFLLSARNHKRYPL